MANRGIRQDRGFQSTQPMRAATIFHFGKFLHVRKISIHAAHEGCDEQNPQARLQAMIFQSTQPMRAATLPHASGEWQITISIHAAHEGCDKSFKKSRDCTLISIHAAHEGCD